MDARDRPRPRLRGDLMPNNEFGPKVRLATLHERTSQNGNRYFSGLLGASTVLMFRDPDNDSEQWGEAWSLLVQERTPKRQGSSDGEQPRQRRQAARKPPHRVAGDPRPFDDDIGF